MPYNRREQQYENFQAIASACLQRKQLQVTYHNRSQNLCEPLTLSPQVMIYYRDNWYLGVQFTAEAARWVEGVIWHPDQDAGWQDDGTYRLAVPYSLPTELIGEILRFGEGVTVLEPPELRAVVHEKLKKMLANY